MVQAAGVVVGEGFRFGYKAKGDTRALQRLAAERGLAVRVVDLVQLGAADVDDAISSSKVSKSNARCICQDPKPTHCHAPHVSHCHLFNLSGKRITYAAAHAMMSAGPHSAGEGSTGRRQPAQGG